MNNAIAFIFVTVALDAIGLGIIIPVLPDLLKEVMQVDVSNAARWGGLLAASYAVTQFAFGPLLGSLSDKLGRRPVLLLGLVALGIDYIIMGLADTIWVLLAGRLLAGAAGSTYVTANAYIADVSPANKRAANFGMVGAAFGTGFILGPIIGGLLGEWGTRTPFFAAAILAVVNFLYGYFVLPESLTKENRRAFSWAKSNPLSAIIIIRQFPALGWIFLALFLFNIAHFVYPAVWAYWGQEVFDWTAWDIGLSLAIVGLGFAVVQGVLIHRIMSRLGETRTALFALGINLFSFLFCGLIGTEWLIYAAIPIISFGALVTPAISGILSNVVPADEQGLLQGVISGLAAISTIISPIIMTQLFFAFTQEETGPYLPGAPYLMAALLTVMATGVFIIGIRRGGVLDKAK